LTVTGTDGNNSASAAFIRKLVRGDTFIPYEQLTKEEIISWLEAANDVVELQASAEHEYNQIKNAGNQEILPPPFEV